MNPAAARELRLGLATQEVHMPLYLHQWRYNSGEVRAMVTQPQPRADVVKVAAHAFGGTIHGFYFCFGDYDGVAISEFPDDETAMAFLMTVVGQGGLAVTNTTNLLTPEQAVKAMDRAHHAVTGYAPPSGGAAKG